MYSADCVMKLVNCSFLKYMYQITQKKIGVSLGVSKGVEDGRRA
jgi:hypothetical protein